MITLPFTNLRNRLKILRRTKRSGYHFSASDYWLYLQHAEQPGPAKHFPNISVVEQDDKYIQLQIVTHRYYWPREVNWNGLAWMHQEVFVPASRNFHAYEFAGVQIKPGDHVIDAGASEGFFTQYALQRGARVLALEPVPSLAEALKKTFAAEIACGQVKVIPVALAATSARAHLDLKQERIYESQLSSTGLEIQTICLDDIAGQEPVDFIKMDIEGAEVNAIRGGAKLITTNKPRLAIAVYHQQENARQVCQLLREMRPDYQIKNRGIYAWCGSTPRPAMVYVW